MKTSKPSILKMVIVIVFLIGISYLGPIVNQYALDYFNYIPKFILMGVVILALNYFILQDQINNWRKKGTLIIHSTYLLIAILLITLIILAPFFNIFPMEYIDFVFFTICYCILRSFEKKVEQF